MGTNLSENDTWDTHNHGGGGGGSDGGGGGGGGKTAGASTVVNSVKALKLMDAVAIQKQHQQKVHREKQQGGDLENDDDNVSMSKNRYVEKIVRLVDLLGQHSSAKSSEVSFLLIDILENEAATSALRKHLIALTPPDHSGGGEDLASTVETKQQRRDTVEEFLPDPNSSTDEDGEEEEEEEQQQRRRKEDIYTTKLKDSDGKARPSRSSRRHDRREKGETSSSSSSVVSSSSSHRRSRSRSGMGRRSRSRHRSRSRPRDEKSRSPSRSGRRLRTASTVDDKSKSTTKDDATATTRQKLSQKSPSSSSPSSLSTNDHQAVASTPKEVNLKRSSHSSSDIGHSAVAIGASPSTAAATAMAKPTRRAMKKNDYLDGIKSSHGPTIRPPRRVDSTSRRLSSSMSRLDSFTDASVSATSIGGGGGDLNSSWEAGGGGRNNATWSISATSGVSGARSPSSKPRRGRRNSKQGATQNFFGNVLVDVPTAAATGGDSEGMVPPPQQGSEQDNLNDSNSIGFLQFDPTSGDGPNGDVVVRTQATGLTELLDDLRHSKRRGEGMTDSDEDDDEGVQMLKSGKSTSMMRRLMKKQLSNKGLNAISGLLSKGEHSVSSILSGRRSTAGSSNHTAGSASSFLAPEVIIPSSMEGSMTSFGSFASMGSMKSSASKSSANARFY